MSNPVPVFQAPVVEENHVVIDVENFHERYEAMRSLVSAIVSGPKG